MSDFDQAWRSAAPQRAQEPMSPPDAEKRIESLSEALEENEQALVAAADAELDAQGDLDNAEIRWRLDDGCPQAGVADGKRITVAYVNAWVANQTAPQREALKVAKQRRNAAEKQRDRISRQLIAAQSLAKSVSASLSTVR